MKLIWCPNGRLVPGGGPSRRAPSDTSAAQQLHGDGGRGTRPPLVSAAAGHRLGWLTTTTTTGAMRPTVAGGHAASGRTQFTSAASAVMAVSLSPSRHSPSRSATIRRVSASAVATASATELLEPKEQPSSHASSPSSPSVASYQLPGHWERQMKSAPMGKRRVLQR